MTRIKLDILEAILVLIIGIIIGAVLILILTKSVHTTPSSEASGGFPAGFNNHSADIGRFYGAGLPPPALFDTNELEIITKAAERNGCYGDDFLILLAIRKAENGGPGNEFGVQKVQSTDLDTQAAWAAATIVKNRGRWREAGRPDSFTQFLSRRYCPLNSEIWESNVKHWFERLKKWNE